jgi:hypothetical protein
MPTTQVGNYARQKVCWNKQGSPHLVLPDVHVLVRPTPRQLSLASPKHDVTQGKGGRSARKRDGPSEKPCYHPSMDLQDAADAPHSTPADQCEWDEQATK